MKGLPRGKVRATGESSSVALDAPSLGAVLGRDASAWRAFVGHYDGRLRSVVRHATEATDALSDAEIDDVLGDFWLAVVADDMRMLRAFKPERESSLLMWLTFHVAQVAYERLAEKSDASTFVPLHEARNVAAPGRLSIDDTIRAAVHEAITAELRQAARHSAPPPATVVSEYLSPAHAAEVAGVKAATIREWIAKDKLPGHRAGRLLRVRRDELERFLRGVKTTSGAVDIEVRRRQALARLK